MSSCATQHAQPKETHMNRVAKDSNAIELKKILFPNNVFAPKALKADERGYNPLGHSL